MHTDMFGLVVLGSLNFKVSDRYLTRSQVRPLQLLSGGRAVPIGFFDGWGRIGLSSLAWHADAPFIWFLSTGDDLVCLDVRKGDVRPLSVPGLQDVHEMTVIGDDLWIANTGRDEVVAFSLKTETVRERRGLALFRARDADYQGTDQGDVEFVDRFHCNQVFEGMEGDRYVLVHHVSGIQLMRRLADKLLKEHGNGGVINLTRGHAIRLNLRAPHSVRVVGDHYWVADSGRNKIVAYDRKWHIVESYPLPGWGRGAAVGATNGTIWVGISEVRKRYLNVLESRASNANMVVGLDVLTGAPRTQTMLRDVEQVNNVYLIDNVVASAVLDLPLGGSGP